MVDLYPHQEEAIQKLESGKILWGGVGTGKSRTAAAYYFRKENPRDVYVITTAKKRDSVEWEGEFARYGIGKARDASIGGILTVDSWNNIDKYKRVKDAFFIFDEQRLVGDGTWVTAFLAISKANRWILLSATPGDTWLDYIPVFIANGFYKNRTEFKRDHVVYKTYSKFPKVERYTGLGRLVRHRNSILVEMPYLRHTVRHSQDVPVEFDKELFDKVVKRKWNVYQNKPLRSVAELFVAMRRVVNSDSSRLAAVLQLLTVHPRLIVFYNFDYELEVLRTLPNVQTQEWTPKPQEPTLESIKWQTPLLVNTMSSASELSTKETSLELGSTVSAARSLTPQPRESTMSTIASIRPGSTPQNSLSQIKMLKPSLEISSQQSTMSPESLTIAEWNGHKHQAIPKTERWLYLVQYAAGAEGWNCTTTDAVCFYSLPYSYKLYHQAHGRIDRLNTGYSDLYYYVLMSNSLIDREIKKCLILKRNFNESTYGRL